MNMWRDLIRAPILVNFPKGMTPDPSSDWGGFALMNAANNYAQNPAIVFSNATTNDLTAVQVVGNGLLLRQGAPGGPVTDTLPTAVAMIGQMQGPTNIPLEGTYSEPLRILNTTGQTITLATNTGLTLSGTMTIEDGTWRDFMLTPTSATAVIVLNVGSGMIVSPSTFTNLVVDNLTVNVQATIAAATISGTLNVLGNAGFNGNLSIAQDLTVAGNSTLAGTLTLSGQTPNSFLYSGAAGLVSSTAAPTNGQLLIGSTGVAPVLGTITGVANQIIVTPGAGTISLATPQDIGVGSSPSFAGLTLQGGLTFFGLGLRITGDLNNATHANRLLFQTSTVNASSSIGVIPNGSGPAGQINLYSSSDPNNASLLQLRVESTVAQLISSLTGTGSFVPLTILTGGAERVRITTAGLFGLGMTPSTALDITAATNAGMRVTDGTVSTIVFNTASSSASIGTTSNHPVNIFTNNSGKVTVTAGGLVGIGITPTSGNNLEVHVASDRNLAISTQVQLAGSVSISALNDAASLNLPLEFRGSQFGYYGGGTEHLAISTTGDITGRGIALCRSKTNDTSRNTTTVLAADPDLTITLAAATTYQLTFFVVFLASVATAMGGKFALTYTGTFSGTGLGEANGDNGSWGISQRFIMNTTMINATADITTGLVLRGTIGLRTVNGGTLSIDWAQNASNANNLSLKAGSFLTVTKLAG